MMPKRYLNGIRYGETFMDGVYMVDDYRSQDSSRWVGSYADLRASKLQILHIAYRISRQRENPADWDVHHIVERKHLADVDFQGTLGVAYEQELPCVLIHRKSEHQSYTSTLGSPEATMLFRSRLPKRMADRSLRAQELCTEATGRKLLRSQAQLLMEMYSNHYEGDPALERIARNVFRSVLKGLA
jgi:hypothetical protein